MLEEEVISCHLGLVVVLVLRPRSDANLGREEIVPRVGTAGANNDAVANPIESDLPLEAQDVPRIPAIPILRRREGKGQQGDLAREPLIDRSTAAH